MTKKLFFSACLLTALFFGALVMLAPISMIPDLRTVSVSSLTASPWHRFVWVASGLFVGACASMGTLFALTLRPIKKVLFAVQKEGVSQMGSRIKVRDEFGELARAIESLYERCQKQKESLDWADAEKAALLECLDEGAVVFDDELRVKMSNRAASKILKAPRDDLTGKTPTQLAEKIAPPIWRKSYELLKKAIETQSVIAGTLHGEGQGKSHIALRAMPLPRSAGAVLILQDTSSQYKVLEMGRDFVANASHELRTPITIIKGFAETLRDVPEISGAMLEDITQKIVRNCERMNNLVRNLLLLADLDSFTKARVQPCDLVGLIDNCNQSLLMVYPNAIVETLYNKQEIMIQADPDLFELALTNLLQNAVKYSREEPQIQVTLEEKENEVVLSIADKGVGIPAKDLPYIFDRFYTVDKAHSRRMGGAGLGLSIVKRIIEKHEGAIHVSSVVGQGTTFTIILPLLPY